MLTGSGLPWWARWLRDTLPFMIQFQPWPLCLSPLSFPLEDCQVLFWNGSWTPTNVYRFKWLCWFIQLTAECLEMMTSVEISRFLTNTSCQSVPLSLHKNNAHRCLAVLSGRHCARCFTVFFSNSHVSCVVTNSYILFIFCFLSVLKLFFFFSLIYHSDPVTMKKPEGYSMGIPFPTF